MHRNSNFGARLVARGLALALGALLGAASLGGSASAAPTETVLHAFKGSDGSSPLAGLFADSKVNLYGTTFNGGASNRGVVFQLAPPVPPETQWTETVLHAFMGSDGANPHASLIADKGGNLYGTAQLAGVDLGGVAFKLPRTGNYTVHYSFCSKTSCNDGDSSIAGLIADSKGNLYGTTFLGGAHLDGTVFELKGTGFVP